ncbi:ribose ABC transporter ATP-binding protein [Spirochaetia bacterium]|nr:ribose ABC transporter ATP-binding protein [Spirochaetia bacterium]
MEKVLELKDIKKQYPGVMALKGVSLGFNRGEIHAIVGENGAGKSTLIKIIAGAETASSGQIVIEGESCESLSPKQGKEYGIEVIYQEFNLVESLSAAENIFLGEKFGPLVDFKIIENKAAEIFKKFEVNINPQTIVEKLTPAQMQIVEIAKAVTKKAKILIMDEPTAPLTVHEVEHLFKIIAELKAQGITILYISHRLEEIFEIADRVSVLRDGEYICTKNTKETNKADLINLMVGRVINAVYDKSDLSADIKALEIQEVSGNGVNNISFFVKKGEILGIGGLVGSGRTELARLIFGADPLESGTIIRNGQQISFSSPKDAMKYGIGLIPEDRKREGCFLDKKISWNISITSIKELSKSSIVNTKLENNLAENYISSLKIKTPSQAQLVMNLSGGNQQKVALAKILAVKPDVIIFDEPTRGIDIGTREEIYTLMVNLTKEGKSIIMISSDMEELIGMSDRIIVLCEGKLSGELKKAEFSQNRVMELASQFHGGNQEWNAEI